MFPVRFSLKKRNSSNKLEGLLEGFTEFDLENTYNSDKIAVCRAKIVEPINLIVQNFLKSVIVSKIFFH